MSESYTNLQTGEVTKIEPYDYTDDGMKIESGHRCKVTIGDREPIILDRTQLESWIGHMDKWGET